MTKSGQLSLFSPEETPSPVGPAETSESIRSIAERLPERLYLGTSSWSFPGWERIVYDRRTSKGVLARHGLAAYARHPLFRAVGIDRTYYAPMPAHELREYAASVPAEFRFLVKAHEVLTSPYPRESRELANETFLDAGYARDEVVGPVVEGLGDRGAIVLFQFPPLGRRSLEAIGGPSSFAEALQRFLSALPEGPRYAVELRNAGLLTPSYAGAIASAGAAHVYNVHPTMPSVAEQSRTVDPASQPDVVVRWMLRADRGYEDALDAYAPFDRIVEADTAAREGVVQLCARALGAEQRAFVVVNNKAEGSAPLSIARLAELFVSKIDRP